MKVSCDIIRDLLPLCAEDLASEDSRELVKTHLSECPACRAVLEELEKKPTLPPETDTQGLERVRRSIRSRRWYMAALCCFSAAAVLFGLFFCLTEPLYLKKDEAIESVTEEDGQITVNFRNTVSLFVVDVSAAGEGEEAGEGSVCVQGGYRLIDTVFDGEYYRYPASSPLILPAGTQRVWYGGDGTEDILLWGEPADGGRITLPRLVMNYYFLLALAAGGILGIMAFCLRKRRVGSWVLAAAAFFWCFSMAVPVVTFGRFQTFHAPRAFVGAGILALLLWGAFCTAWKLLRMNKKV